MVHVVEREEELVEDAELAPVAGLELAQRLFLVDESGEGAVDRAGREERAVRRQVDA
ncbi:hypothetical protein SAV31267_008590 [Streptomyces avermitilis]|uniref:Uncharacterized protein n=1 Tax=Streptomyces avermitilis TaxID=33903 RepID=A0A4D4MI31_STRAX|nr:hypothetical protein SAV31267_008590 [Streptomyces avermitilis]